MIRYIAITAAVVLGALPATLLGLYTIFLFITGAAFVLGIFDGDFRVFLMGLGLLVWGVCSVWGVLCLWVAATVSPKPVPRIIAAGLLAGCASLIFMTFVWPPSSTVASVEPRPPADHVYRLWLFGGPVVIAVWHLLIWFKDELRSSEV